MDDDQIARACREFNFDNGGPFGNEHRVERLSALVREQVEKALVGKVDEYNRMVKPQLDELSRALAENRDFATKQQARIAALEAEIRRLSEK